MILKTGEWYTGGHRRGNWSIQSLGYSVTTGNWPRQSIRTCKNRPKESRILWRRPVRTRRLRIGLWISHLHAYVCRYVVTCCGINVKEMWSSVHEHSRMLIWASLADTWRLCCLQTKVGIKKGIKPTDYIIRVNPFGADKDAFSTTFYKSFISDGQVWNGYCGAAMHWNVDCDCHYAFGTCKKITIEYFIFLMGIRRAIMLVLGTSPQGLELSTNWMALSTKWEPNR